MKVVIINGRGEKKAERSELVVREEAKKQTAGWKREKSVEEEGGKWGGDGRCDGSAVGDMWSTEGVEGKMMGSGDRWTAKKVAWQKLATRGARPRQRHPGPPGDRPV